MLFSDPVMMVVGRVLFPKAADRGPVPGDPPRLANRRGGTGTPRSAATKALPPPTKWTRPANSSKCRNSPPRTECTGEANPANTASKRLGPHHPLRPAHLPDPPTPPRRGPLPAGPPLLHHPPEPRVLRQAQQQPQHHRERQRHVQGDSPQPKSQHPRRSPTITHDPRMGLRPQHRHQLPAAHGQGATPSRLTPNRPRRPRRPTNAPTPPTNPWRAPETAQTMVKKASHHELGTLTA